MRRFFVVLVAATSPLPALADLASDYFGNPALPSSGCYIRQYGAAHLARHPEQTVTEIALHPSALPDEPGFELLDVFVQVKATNYEYHGLAYCEPSAKRWRCGLEGDAGSFTLTGEKPGVLRLTLNRDGISFEGAQDFLTLYGDRGDDRVFLIPNVDGDLCN
jgi:hypothetical protein